MEKVDDLTREKLREWQMRRLEIKDRIQSHPEQTLELSRVLDLMDDEHAEILSQAEMIRSADVANEPTPPLTGAYTLQLNVAAQSAEDLRRLLDMAVFELQQQVNAMAATADAGPHCGGMSGSLGEYRFELGGHGNA
ncbi:hypothetical protein [Pseudomonas canadensis]|uniref:hypothetical protein n=1 Tax=Pseudomonas canadensis TaxID=915099 RepID=UPI0030DA11F1